MGKSKIEWTDATWNWLAGCTRDNECCDNCYAAGMSIRLEAMALADRDAGRDPGAKAKYIGVARRNSAGRTGFVGAVNFDEGALLDVFSWRKPRRIFVNSMSDTHHPAVAREWLDLGYAAMAANPHHTFLVLTKRPHLLADYLNDPETPARIRAVGEARGWRTLESGAWPIPNVWGGTSVGLQAHAEEKIPHLLRAPLARRFLSCEPLLGPLDLRQYLDRLDWVITGGESGPRARPMHPQWALDIRDQCQSADVAFFFKQWGEWLPAEASGSPEAITAISKITREHYEHGRAKATASQHVQLMPYLTTQQFCYRVGKHAAGRELDGVIWDQIPD